MNELDDFALDHHAEPPAAPPARNYKVLATAIVALVAVGGGVAYYLSTRNAAPPAPAATPAPTLVEEPTAPSLEAMKIVLPPLPETDPIVRELVSSLSSQPVVMSWLATKGLIANFTVVTLNISEGRTPVSFLRAVAPRGRFRTTGSGEALVLDPRSYERYNGHAQAVDALDATGTARLYLTLKPRILEAYRELGYPEGDFDPVLERAIGVLLGTPVIDGPVALRPKTLSYAFASSQLESLPAAQKQFLRMGPQNVQVVQAKLREIAGLLNLHPESAR